MRTDYGRARCQADASPRPRATRTRARTSPSRCRCLRPRRRGLSVLRCFPDATSPDHRRRVGGGPARARSPAASNRRSPPAQAPRSVPPMQTASRRRPRLTPPTQTRTARTGSGTEPTATRTGAPVLDPADSRPEPRAGRSWPRRRATSPRVPAGFGEDCLCIHAHRSPFLNCLISSRYDLSLTSDHKQCPDGTSAGYGRRHTSFIVLENLECFADLGNSALVAHGAGRDLHSGHRALII
jgi:hypothetical protein